MKHHQLVMRVHQMAMSEIETKQTEKSEWHSQSQQPEKHQVNDND